MEPKHRQFLEAIVATERVCVRFDSPADSRVSDRVGAPMDYDPGGDLGEHVPRYGLWEQSIQAHPRGSGQWPRRAMRSIEPPGQQFKRSQAGPAGLSPAADLDSSIPKPPDHGKLAAVQPVPGIAQGRGCGCWGSVVGGSAGSDVSTRRSAVRRRRSGVIPPESFGAKPAPWRWK
jgi:hypothetical protein